MTMKKYKKIAVDGYSSCGKSTLAKALAHKLGFLYIDSGSMYRAVTFFYLQNDSIPDKKKNHARITGFLENIEIDFVGNAETGNFEIYLDGKNVENNIRSMEVSENVSEISKIKEVREKMVALQQKLSENQNVIMDGRDIGTVVFPDADLKIFMTADVAVRAMRRYAEMKEKGIKTTLEEVKKNIQKRDELDENREISPLKKADDAIILDNSRLSKEEQLQFALEKVNDIR